MERHTGAKALAIGLLVVAMTLGAFTVRVLNPTYTVHNVVLSAQEFRALVDENPPAACVQSPGAIFDSIGFTVAYACFDTQTEADAYGRDVWRAQ